jgi:hypothetical protein
VFGVWWLVVGGWWLVVSGWWLVVGGLVDSICGAVFTHVRYQAVCHEHFNASTHLVVAADPDGGSARHVDGTHAVDTSVGQRLRGYSCKYTKHRRTDRQTRQTDKQAGRQADRQTDRRTEQTDRMKRMVTRRSMRALVREFQTHISLAVHVHTMPSPTAAMACTGSCCVSQTRLRSDTEACEDSQHQSRRRNTSLLRLVKKERERARRNEVITKPSKTAHRSNPMGVTHTCTCVDRQGLQRCKSVPHRCGIRIQSRGSKALSTVPELVHIRHGRCDGAACVQTNITPALIIVQHSTNARTVSLYVSPVAQTL